MITFAGLGLWVDEERKIQECLVAALRDLRHHGAVSTDDDEDTISGKLRPFIKERSKKLEYWTFHPEASIFSQVTDRDASGYPDIQFSRRDTDGNQWDYDVECKLVRIKRRQRNTGKLKSHNYIQYYIEEGVDSRFVKCLYCANVPSGTMIGYLQEGDPQYLLIEINKRAKVFGIRNIRKIEKWKVKDVTHLSHSFDRKNNRDFRLHHLWADLRS